MPDCLDDYGFGTLWEVQHGEEHLVLTEPLYFEIDRDGWTLDGQPIAPGKHYWAPGKPEPLSLLGDAVPLSVDPQGVTVANLDLDRKLEHYDDPKPTIRFLPG